MVVKLVQPFLEGEHLPFFNLDQQDFPYPWKESSWRSLDFKRYSLYGLYREEQLAGFSLYYLPEPGLAHLLKIVVAKDSRGLGLGLKLLSGSEQELSCLGCRRFILEVAEDNERALHFYHQAGFEELNKVRGFYSDGKAALSMEKRRKEP